MYVFIFKFRGGMDVFEGLREQYSSAVSCALENAEAGSKNMLSSIDRKYFLFRHEVGLLRTM